MCRIGSLDETLTLVLMRLGHAAGLRLWDQIDASRRLRREWVDPVRFDKARTWFHGWSDRGFFRQAGFEVTPA